MTKFKIKKIKFQTFPDRVDNAFIITKNGKSINNATYFDRKIAELVLKDFKKGNRNK